MAIHYKNVCNGVVHCGGTGNDYTVCGLSESDDKSIGIVMKETKEKVTCANCIRVIEHCKSVRKSEIGEPVEDSPLF